MDSPISLIAEQADLRVDKYVHSRCPDFSRTFVQKLIDDGHLTVNGVPIKPSYLLKTGDVISILVPPPETTDLLPQEMPLEIVYEDDDLLVIDKAAGMTVHPAPGHPDRTLVNAVLAHCPDVLNINNTVRPGIVHRLDKDTSGLMMVAKNSRAQASLVQQMKDRQTVKKYLALVQGHIKPEEGAIDAPVGRHPAYRKKMAVVSNGRPARTLYALKETVGDNSLLEVTLETGRTHQIRVHLAAIGYPVVGDSVYGKPSALVQRQFLHSHYLRFKLPSDGRVVEFTSPLPEDLQDVLQALRQGRVPLKKGTPY